MRFCRKGSELSSVVVADFGWIAEVPRKGVLTKDVTTYKVTPSEEQKKAAATTHHTPLTK